MHICVVNTLWMTVTYRIYERVTSIYHEWQQYITSDSNISRVTAIYHECTSDRSGRVNILLEQELNILLEKKLIMMLEQKLNILLEQKMVVIDSHKRYPAAIMSVGYCKKDVTPLLTHWSYVFLALTNRCLFFSTLGKYWPRDIERSLYYVAGVPQCAMFLEYLKAMVTHGSDSAMLMCLFVTCGGNRK